MILPSWFALPSLMSTVFTYSPAYRSPSTDRHPMLLSSETTLTRTSRSIHAQTQSPSLLVLGSTPTVIVALRKSLSLSPSIRSSLQAQTVTPSLSRALHSHVSISLILCYPMTLLSICIYLQSQYTRSPSHSAFPVPSSEATFNSALRFLDCSSSLHHKLCST